MKMKNLLITVLIFNQLLLAACDKDSEGTNYDFSNSLPAYVQISDKTAIEATEGEEVTVDFDIRTAFQKAVNITYDVSGAVNLSGQTATIARNSKSGSGVFVIPAGAATPPDTAMAVVTLKTATLEDGTVLTISRKNTPEKEVVDLLILPE